MEASSQRTWQVRLALMLGLGVAAAAACVMTLMVWKAPAASGQEETSPTEASFLVRCEFSHRKPADPIVDFGDKTSFHMHDFFGNTTTNANSTLESLRAAPSPTDPGTTCTDHPEDTAAYWIPRVSWTDSRGNTTKLTASQGRFYYRLGAKSPNVDVQPHPAGLKIVTVQGSNVEWRCFNGTWSTTPPTQCSNGKLVVRIFFPDCLAEDANGRPLLDSEDHRSHMVDVVRPSDGGKATCPSTHPIPVPRLQTNVEFPIPTTRGKPKLSSGAYSTMHADFFNAWDQARLEHLVDTCLNNEPFTASNPKPQECL
jgi:Domain of unknown function (DUF1996)